MQNDNQDKFAGAIFDAFLEYKGIYETGKSSFNMVPSPKNIIDTVKEIVAKEIVVKKQVIPDKDLTPTKVVYPKTEINKQFYTIQIMAVTKVLASGSSELKGYREAAYSKVGNFYKYYIGKFNTSQDAAGELNKIKRSFPQSFIIKVENGIIVPMTNK